MSDDIDTQSQELRSGRGGRRGGARLTMEDGRVSRGIAWSAGIIGSLLVIALTFCANNLWQLNLTMRDVLAANTVSKEQLADHESRIRAIEGTRFRGVDGYGAMSEKKEPTRGK